jgi:hypothetical protein
MLDGSKRCAGGGHARAERVAQLVEGDLVVAAIALERLLETLDQLRAIE